MAPPDRPVTLVAAKQGEAFQMGPFTVRILEDGSNTDNRMGSAEISIPPQTKGPPAHWHEMHDETFLVTRGKMVFHYPGKPDIAADTGDYVVVPIRAPHTFSNPYQEEAVFFSTYTPAFYINYFKLLGQMQAEGKEIGKQDIIDAMARFATLPVDPIRP